MQWRVNIVQCNKMNGVVDQPKRQRKGVVYKVMLEESEKFQTVYCLNSNLVAVEQTIFTQWIFLYIRVIQPRIAAAYQFGMCCVIQSRVLHPFLDSLLARLKHVTFSSKQSVTMFLFQVLVETNCIGNLPMQLELGNCGFQ